MKNAILSGILFLAAIAVHAQTADEIIQKHLEATGSAAWEKITSMKTEAKLTIQAAPGMEIPMVLTVVNNKSARVEVSAMGMTQVSCINGDKGWSNNPFAGKNDPEPLTTDQVNEMKQMTDLAGHLYNYKTKGYTVEYLGKEDVDGTEMHKIKIVISPTRTEYALIDPETFLEAKSITVATVDGKESKSESAYSNYKEVNGVKIPHTIEENNPAMGGTAVTTVTKITVNEPVDAAIFEMPAKK
ncbi:MAG: hypothetical protein KGS48_10445 [Bacteroidetes bacterium]|nr:hypothetical protein [Bacteroidota bacterium]